jgi:hypothetical protein
VVEKSLFCQYLVTNSWKLLQKIKLQASAKIINEKKFSIISDYIGRPVQAFSDTGKLIWETDYDIYGGLRNHHETTLLHCSELLRVTLHLLLQPVTARYEAVSSIDATKHEATV